MPTLYARYAAFCKHFWQQLSPAAAFVGIASVAGLAFCFITPPFQTPDEMVHYYRTYQISEGHLVARAVKGGYGDLLPQNMDKQIHDMVGKIPFHPETKYDAGKTWRYLGQPLDSTRLTPVHIEATAPPLAYIPQSIGVGAGRLLGLSVVAQLFLGRLANLALWMAVVFWAIRLIPFGKWAVFALALTPMSMFEAASLSPDALVNASAFIFVAVGLRLVFVARRIASWEYVCILAPVIIFALLKIAYLPLGVLIALIPARNFGSSRKKWALLVAAMAIGLVLSSLWSYRVRHIQEVALARASAKLGYEIAPRAQLGFIKRHPITYAWTILNTYVTTQGDAIEQQFVGVLGWLDTRIPLWIVTLDILLIAYCLASTRPPRGPTLWERLVISIAALGALAGVTTALYVYYTPVGYPFVIGLQGRYLIPLAPLLIPLVANPNSSVRPSERSIKATAVIISVVVLTLSVCVMSYRYYHL